MSVALEQQFVCNICHHFTRSSFKAVLRHMSDHRCEPSVRFVCSIGSCKEVYQNFDSYRKHIYRKHRNLLELPDNASNQLSNTDQSVPSAEGSYSTAEDLPPVPKKLLSKRSSALFLLKTRAERKVTQAALDGIISDVSGLWSDAMDAVKVST